MLYTIIFCLALWVLEMNRPSTFGLTPGLPKTEFVHLLTSHSVDHLKSFRGDLFDEVLGHNLVPSYLLGLPLVNRRDSPLRPITRVLSEDIWSLVMCINTKTPVPRTLLRNGKRSKEFIGAVDTRYVSHSVDSHSLSESTCSQLPMSSVCANSQDSVSANSQDIVSANSQDAVNAI